MYDLIYDTSDSELDQYKNKFIIKNFKILENSYLKLSICSKIYKNSNKELIAIKYYDHIKNRYLLEIINDDYSYDIDELNIDYDKIVTSEELESIRLILSNFIVV